MYKPINVCCSYKEPNRVNRNSDLHHRIQLKRVAKRKQELHAELDKRLKAVKLHCIDDKTSPICKILWDDLETCIEQTNYETMLQLSNNEEKDSLLD